MDIHFISALIYVLPIFGKGEQSSGPRNLLSISQCFNIVGFSPRPTIGVSENSEESGSEFVDLSKGYLLCHKFSQNRFSPKPLSRAQPLVGASGSVSPSPAMFLWPPDGHATLLQPSNAVQRKKTRNCNTHPWQLRIFAFGRSTPTPFPFLQVTGILQTNEHTHSVSQTEVVGHFDTNQLPSNSPCEDKRSEAVCRDTGGV